MLEEVRDNMIEVIHYTKEDEILYNRLHELFYEVDGKVYRRFSRGRSKAGSLVGGLKINPCGYRYWRLAVDGKEFQRSHVVYHMHHGHTPRKPLQIDHINTNSLDDRVSNLRPATVTQQMYNQNKQSDCTSSYIGVNWNKNSKKWEARIRSNGKRIRLGLFDNEIDAAIAYNTAALSRDSKVNKLNDV